MNKFTPMIFFDIYCATYSNSNAEQNKWYKTNIISTNDETLRVETKNSNVIRIRILACNEPTCSSPVYFTYGTQGLEYFYVLDNGARRYWFKNWLDNNFPYFMYEIAC